MFFIIFLIRPVSERRKHGTILHMMSVNDRIGIRKPRCIKRLNKYGTCPVLRPVICMTQIKIIIFSLQHRIINIRPFTIDPAYHITVYTLQRREVHGDRHTLRRLFPHILRRVFFPCFHRKL